MFSGISFEIYDCKLVIIFIIHRPKRLQIPKHCSSCEHVIYKALEGRMNLFFVIYYLLEIIKKNLP